VPLIWGTIQPGKLDQWISAQQQSGPPPYAYELVHPPPLQKLLQDPVAAPLKSALWLHPDSGALQFNVQALPASRRNEEEIMTFSIAIANALDRRDAFFWTGLDKEESGGPENLPKAAAMEYWFSIDGMRPVGPGGRITYYPQNHSVEIVVRRRGSRLGGHWRNAADLANRVLNYLELDGAQDARLRAAFGYYEASKYERQFLLRPVFVFLLDRPFATSGPRWRVATVVAATELPERAATAGIGLASGCA
jgi:hypothetical protein